jgi:hypothetical protein
MASHSTLDGSCAERQPLSRRRALAGLGGAALAGAALRPSGARAQEATPCPGTGCAPRLGDTLFIAAANGQAVGEIVVEEFIEPFDGFDPAVGPPRGSHFAAVRVAYEATGQQQMSVNTSAFVLQYSDSFIAYPTAVQFAVDSDETALSGGPVEPGSGTSGLVTFSVVNGLQVDRIFYFPQGDRLFLLAELC